MKRITTNIFNPIVPEKRDNEAGIRMSVVAQMEPYILCSTWMEAGEEVRHHYHGSGKEFYYILYGHGELSWRGLEDADYETRIRRVGPGDMATIPEETVHHLKAQSPLHMLFLCPRTHLEKDRYFV